MTLIEVLAGLVILGTVLASVAIARGRFLRQWRDADERLAAARAVDELIGGWMVGSQVVPVPAKGPLQQPPGYLWRTRYVPNRSVEALNAAVVRVEAVADRAPDARALLAVDILVHRTPASTTRPAPQSGGRTQ